MAVMLGFNATLVPPLSEFLNDLHGSSLFLEYGYRHLAIAIQQA